jgi:ribosomal protein S18 acetylase RimI-like enzyme
MDIAFRLADGADAPGLAEFMARNFIAAYGHCSTPANIAAAVAEHYGIAAQQRQLADPGRCNLLAVAADGSIAGHAQLRFGATAPAPVAPLPAAELARFYVDSAWHGRGIAQTMMAEVRARAATRGARALWLSVWQEQPQAIRFYEKEGFRIAGALVFVVGDDPKDDWLMLRELS